jgi:3-oxoacyl-[acyl-carrier-protein] synthase II
LFEEERHGKRVGITGIGAITPIGSGVEGLWRGTIAGRSAVRRVSRFDVSGYRSQVAAQVDDFDPLDHMEAQRARRLDRYSLFAVAAAQQAVLDSGLCLSASEAEHTGVYLGSALGGLSFAEEQHVSFMNSGLRSVNNILALTVFGSASSCNVAMEMGLFGPNQTNANSCASGAVAIGEAYRLIRNGGARIMLAGGVEAPLAPLVFGAFDLIRALSSNSNAEPEYASRPFDARRDGFVLSEGSAVLVLEELDHARARGAKIYAEVKGYATTTDAYHMTAPRPDGLQASRAMREALAEARLLPNQVDYINAHASATPLNDKTETLVIKQVFGEAAYRVPISGTKAMHGHALGASGAFELAIACLTLERDYLPPTINLRNPDPECDLDYVTGEGRHVRIDTLLSNSFGFGGINACVILARV